MEILTGHISIKSILENNRNIFQIENNGLIRENTTKNVQKILDCGSKKLGFASYKCEDCNEIKYIPFTCKSRFCNSCSQPQSDLWMNKLISWRPSGLRYRHFVFTIPAELRDFFKRHRNALKIIPYTAANSILYFLGKQQKVKPGILAVIHTFGAQLNWNPHVHLIVTNGAIQNSGRFKDNVFYPYNAIKSSRTKFLVKNLKTRVCDNFDGEDCRKKMLELNKFYDYHSKVTGKRANRYVFFGKGTCSFKQVVSYVGRYIKRPVIAQSRIKNFDINNDSVTFNYVDKRDSKIKDIVCHATDFIGLLLQHLPDKSFHMLYYYGAFANRCKSKYLRIINSFFQDPQKLPTIPTSFSQRLFFFTGKDPLRCSCGGYFWKYKIFIPGYPEQFYDP